MRKLLSTLLIVLVAFTAGAQRKYKFVMPAEYEVYAIGEDGKLYAYRDSTGGPVMSPILGVSNCKSLTTGLRNAAVITSNDDEYAAYRTGPDAYKAFRVTGNAWQTGSVWNTHFILKRDSTVWCYNDANRTIYQLTKLPKAWKLSVGHRVFVINAAGEVYSVNYVSGIQGDPVVHPDRMDSVPVVKVTGIPAAQDISSSRHGFTVILNNGYPYGWGPQWGHLGFTADPRGQTALKDLWGVVAPIKEIALNDQTIHYIDVNGDLWGLGDNVQGIVGNGEESPATIANHAWSGIDGTFMVKKAQHIAVGRKFVRIGKSTSMAYYCYAQEDNGVWDSWGRNKGGVLGNGIFMWYYDEHHGNWADVTSPHRINFHQGTFIMDTNWFKVPGNYPPAEATPASVYSNAAAFAFFSKECDALHDGSSVEYRVAAGKYSSTSQQAADNLALNEISQNGQAYANANGVCTIKIVVTFTTGGVTYTLYADKTWK